MSPFQKRTFRIINISPDIAKTVKNCNNTLICFIEDSENPITKKHTRNVRSKTIETRYRTNTAKTVAYSNSFLQKHPV